MVVLTQMCYYLFLCKIKKTENIFWCCICVDSVQAIFPSPEQATLKDQRMNDLIQYARKVEGDMYEAAKDKVWLFTSMHSMVRLCGVSRLLLNHVTVLLTLFQLDIGQLWSLVKVCLSIAEQLKCSFLYSVTAVNEN